MVMGNTFEENKLICISTSYQTADHKYTAYAGMSVAGDSASTAHHLDSQKCAGASCGSSQQVIAGAVNEGEWCISDHLAYVSALYSRLLRAVNTCHLVSADNHKSQL